MGDLRDWSPEVSVGVVENTPNPIPNQGQNQPAISPENLIAAEEVTREIISQVQPTNDSEQRRKAVIDYVYGLIQQTLGCQVHPFGSVPLKTYLPDGDIDLTAFGAPHLEEALANDVYTVLEAESYNESAQFVVKDVQLIRAEVKLVKCLVQNIIVDISFNQLGGLCALCFLEEVDRLILKDHLFKRSVILIKAWCYYESRILGAHHGLISTYALETLVLYIFHLFHSTLHGPLAVLYKFLDYFSKFDWDNSGISLNGPIRLSSLPDIVFDLPENGDGDVLLTDEFLQNTVAVYSLSLRGHESNTRTFASKYLNIVDPLKENNNLGRSVSKGNFYRIKSAFTYGAKKLGRIMSEPEEDLAYQLSKFFTNTLDRHGSGPRPDVEDRMYQEDNILYDTEYLNSEKYRSDPEGLLCVQIDDMNLGEAHGYSNGTAVSEDHVVEDANELAAPNVESKYSSGSGVEGVFAPRPRNFRSFASNGAMSNGILGPKKVGEFGEEIGFREYTNGTDSLLANHERSSHLGSKQHMAVVNPVLSTEGSYLAPGHRRSPTPAVCPEAVNLLADLSGNIQNQLNSLHFGRAWFDFISSPRSPSLPPPVFPSQNAYDLSQRSVSFRHRSNFPVAANGIVRPVFFPMNSNVRPGGGFGMEEMPKPRGTGTYFPNTNHYRDRPLHPRGRPQQQVRSPRNNGRFITPVETYVPERYNRDAVRQLHSRQGVVMPVPDLHLPNVNGLMYPSEADRVVNFQATGRLSVSSPSEESNMQPNSASSFSQSLNASGMQGLPTPAPGLDQVRIAAHSYRLKDEDDFPPLAI